MTTPPEIKFLVQGSAPEPYTIRFVRRSERNLSAYCNCPAGDKGQICKHRTRILNGLTTDIVSDNTDQVVTVVDWVKGSDVEAAQGDVEIAKRKLEEAQKELKAKKKAFVKRMLD
ncbi:hypothetical protein MLD52_21705 [Puniceicoccaceae bacterium K14]|nr:hypothetical protein [Puniceicoccaceae bacterium K14]